MARRRDELDQLLARLNISSLQTKNTPLYEVIAALIRRMKEMSLLLDNTIASGSSGSGSDSIPITNIQQFIDLGLNSSGADGEPGPPGICNCSGSSGGGTMVPYYIGPTETFLVPEFQQALFTMTIDNEGILDVEGFLIEVD